MTSDVLGQIVEIRTGPSQLKGFNVLEDHFLGLRETRETLLKVVPSRPDQFVLSRQLAIVDWRLGDALQTAGKETEARSAYEESVRVSQFVSRHDPKDMESSHTEMSALEGLAAVADHQGRIRESISRTRSCDRSGGRNCSVPGQRPGRPLIWLAYITGSRDCWHVEVTAKQPGQ